MSLPSMAAVVTTEAATDCEVFTAYVEQDLCPRLQPRDVLVMDNLSAHKGAGNPRADRGSGRRTALPTALLAGPESR